ncbi:hypothetical protein FZEAL_9128 [Fusarium zealandicum]|uniref:Uncharacterized protein n=1 Tax=Fusarium zealandicum TaxID=1053134 RepID=A0A8H4UD41_9HYPO|nr:hypothetical protein FZEAL_9128 [Fusarium zealandicum]
MPASVRPAGGCPCLPIPTVRLFASGNDGGRALVPWIEAKSQTTPLQQHMPSRKRDCCSCFPLLCKFNKHEDRQIRFGGSSGSSIHEITMPVSVRGRRRLARDFAATLEVAVSCCGDTCIAMYLGDAPHPDESEPARYHFIQGHEEGFEWEADESDRHCAHCAVLSFSCRCLPVVIGKQYS